jgi:spore germination cell wall hydrolase CwlJ-like protein
MIKEKIIIIVMMLVIIWCTYAVIRNFSPKEQEVAPIPKATIVKTEISDPNEKTQAISEKKIPEIEVEEHECLALNIYHESRSDNFAGRVAVADVVLNRVNHNRYPNTICEVITQAKTRINWKGNIVPAIAQCQFSWYCDGRQDVPRDTDAWEDAQLIAEQLLTDEKFRGITEGATHYHAVYVTPNWINDRGMQLVGRIGEHKFYRWNRR